MIFPSIFLFPLLSSLFLAIPFNRFPVTPMGIDHLSDFNLALFQKDLSELEQKAIVLDKQMSTPREVISHRIGITGGGGE